MPDTGFRTSMKSAVNWVLRWRHPFWWLPDVPSEQDESYRRIWANLRQIEQVEDGRHDTADFYSRSGGLIVVVVRVPQTCFSDDYASLTSALETVPYARLVPPVTFNITIQELGYISSSPDGRDEITQQWLDEYLEQCELSLRDFRPFDVRLGGANSFSDAAILDVHDNGWFSRIHDVLVDFVSQPPRTTYPYLPEFVVAQYQQIAPIGNLVPVLTPFRDTTFGQFRVEAIDVLRFPTNNAFAEPELMRSYPLGTLTGFMDRVTSADSLTAG